MSASSAVLLAIDTSTRTVGVALYDGNQVLSESTWTSVDFHTVELAPSVGEALRRSNLGPEAIGALAVASGPGSFAGLRIGMAFAKGLSLVRHLPIVAVPTLDILASPQPLLDIQLLAVLKVGRGRLAVGHYEVRGKVWRSVSRIEACTPEQLAQQIKIPTYICGEMSESEREIFRQIGSMIKIASPARSLRRPGFLAEIGWKNWEAGRTDDPAGFFPLYFYYNEPIPG